jgi:hypothetical protein
LLVALYFVNSGLGEFQRFQKDKSVFVDYERKSAPEYTDYTQYSGYGFRVLYQPSPVSVFFKNSTIFFDLEGKVDNTQILKIYYLYKGRKLFYVRGHYKDFSGFIFFVGSLFMIYMGVMSMRSLDSLKFTMQFVSLKRFFFMSTGVRLLYLNAFLVLVMAAAYVYARAHSLTFSASELQNYVYYGIFTLTLLNFFYFSGLLLAVILKFKKTAFIWMFVVWLVFTFLVPEINRHYLFEDTKGLPFSESIDIENLKMLMRFQERMKKFFQSTPVKNEEEELQLHRRFHKEFIDNYQLNNMAREARLTQKIKRTIHSFEKQTILFPTLFYHFLAAEASSKGYYGYLDFKDYIVSTQERFLRFFLKKQYILKEKKVENFVKNDENIFTAGSYIPRAYRWAVMFTFLYCLLFMAISYILLLRRVYPYD